MAAKFESDYSRIEIEFSISKCLDLRSLNRTTVELKFSKVERFVFGLAGLNRTTVELKFSILLHPLIAYMRLNRTTVELKFIFVSLEPLAFQV